MKEIYWINALKAICLISVYIVHSEEYYGTGGVSYGYVLRPFYVNAFFLVSGYLFLKKRKELIGDRLFRKVCNVFWKLILPTILFATIIYIPKMLFHATSKLTFGQYVYDVFGGVSYWFTSALAVAQLILIALVFLLKERSLNAYLVVAIILSIISYFLCGIYKSSFPWNYKAGMGVVILMVLGGYYQMKEDKINKFILSSLGGLFLTFFYCVMLLLARVIYIPTTVRVGIDLLGMIVVLVGCAWVIWLVRKLPQISFLSFIGRNSIVYYFFSGVFPASIGLVFSKLFPEKNYLITSAVILLSLVASTIVVVLLNRYIPWMLDFRRLKKNN